VTAASPEAAGEERSEALRTFGRYLHRERELRGLSQADVARVTKLALSVVEALESGEPGRMPPRAYLFGYLRGYSAAVGLDPDDVVLRYQEAVDPGEKEAPPALPAGAGTRPPARWRRGALVAAAIALLVAALLAAGTWRAPRGTGEVKGRRSAERAPYQGPPGQP